MADRDHVETARLRIDPPQRRIVRHMEFVLTREDFVARKARIPTDISRRSNDSVRTPDEAVVVEDSKQGLDAARAAGIACVIVHNRFFGTAHDFTGATAVLRSIDEVPHGRMGP